MNVKTLELDISKDGPVYVSGRVGNTSTPGTDEWWTIESGEDA